MPLYSGSESPLVLLRPISVGGTVNGVNKVNALSQLCHVAGNPPVRGGTVYRSVHGEVGGRATAGWTEI
jgi:hypothetical protein